MSGLSQEAIGELRAKATEVVLNLPSDSPLYAEVESGSVISLAIDASIFPVVAANYDWHFESTRQEFSCLDPDAKYHLLDIGANLGLFCRQVLANFPNVVTASCFEPSPVNIPHLRRNMAGFKGARLHEYGLHRDEGELTFYVDTKNGGNLSFNPDAVNTRPHTKIVAPVRNIGQAIARVEQDEVGKDCRIIWKSDTQGLDEMLMSEMPADFWGKVDLALFEGWRIKKPGFNHDAFRAVLEAFPYAYDRRRRGLVRTDADAIAAYLQADDRKWTDFCLSRRPAEG